MSKRKPTSLAAVRRALREGADPERAIAVARFFKTGKGEYGEGDRFLGVNVPAVRKTAKTHRELGLREVTSLLRSPWHEERLLALIMLVTKYRRSGEQDRQAIFSVYLKNRRFINNWDLVDTSAEHIVGARLLRQEEPDISLLYKLAKSKSLWDRRIAVMSTFHFIKNRRFGETFKLAELLMSDRHDLMHKAIGWMLREIGNRDLAAEEAFLKRHYKKMPRTMLRYAIEKFPERKRLAYLNGTV